MKNNGYKYNHFLQKGFVKNFAINGKIKWKEYLTPKGGEFHITETSNANQPIVEEYFHALEIEKGMNLLEDKGLVVARKIAQQANFQGKIKLSREELVTLKLFSSLSGVRTRKLRNNIRDINGDSLFNEMIKKDGRTPKEIQEEQISIVLKYFEEFNATGTMKKIQLDYFKNVELNNQENLKNLSRHEYEEYIKQNITFKSSMEMNVWEKMKSRLIIFKFDEPKLMLQESMNFNEFNTNGGNKYSFMPIAPNVGLMFYFDPIITRGVIPVEKSLFFKNDISKYRHETIYKNIEIIKQKQMEYVSQQKPKTFEEAQQHNQIFFSMEAGYYYDKKDAFIYDVLKESSKIADICNAMALVHNKDQILIYQKEQDIHDAEEQVIKRGIYRAEEFQ